MASDEETRLMSRMLTQGATMLGEHCDGCGNPLFRVDEDIVCAVCSQGGGDAARSPGSTAEEGGDADDDGRGGVERRGSAATDDGDSLDSEAAEATAEVKENLSRVVRRLSEEASEERDLSRLNQQLDALQKAVDLLERL